LITKGGLNFVFSELTIEVARLWILKRLRVGAILPSILCDYLVIDFDSARFFSAGTRITHPFLVIKCTYENSSPKLIGIWVTIPLIYTSIFCCMR
jgi:hypothetical protein